MSGVWIQPIQKSALQRRPERLSQHNTEHVKNKNLKFKTLQSVSLVIGIIRNILFK